MIGPLPQEVLRGHYERATVFALPCIEAPDGDRDILPNVLKEAMAVGVPVVTTRLDGIEELVEHGGAGLVGFPGDPDGLGARIRLLRRGKKLPGRRGNPAGTCGGQRFNGRMNFAQLRELLSQTVPAEPSKAGQTVETNNLREPATEVNR